MWMDSATQKPASAATPASLDHQNLGPLACTEVKTTTLPRRPGPR